MLQNDRVPGWAPGDPPTVSPGGPELVHSAAPTTPSGRAIRFGFRIAEYGLLITPKTFSEVVPQAVLYPIPNVPPWFLGLLHQRGTLLPVFDLHQLFRVGTRRRGTSTVLVLDQGNEAVGMLIDGMPQPVALSTLQRQVPALPQSLAAYVSMAYSVVGKTWLEFDHRGFFTTLGAQMAVLSGMSVSL